MLLTVNSLYFLDDLLLRFSLRVLWLLLAWFFQLFLSFGLGLLHRLWEDLLGVLRLFFFVILVNFLLNLWWDRLSVVSKIRVL